MSETTDHDENRAGDSAHVDERIRDQTVCIVGLGYVGLPLAVEFDQVDGINSGGLL